MAKDGRIKILIDTREQKKLTFLPDSRFTTVRKKLEVGDYGCVRADGNTMPYYFERKSMSDLFGTMGKGYSRFKREILRAREADCCLILIVEGSLREVWGGVRRSHLRGDSVVKKMFTLLVKYELYPVFVNDRAEMARYILEFYYAVNRWMKRK